jgi:hypothetical protein
MNGCGGNSNEGAFVTRRKIRAGRALTNKTYCLKLIDAHGGGSKKRARQQEPFNCGRRRSSGEIRAIRGKKGPRRANETKSAGKALVLREPCRPKNPKPLQRAAGPYLFVCYPQGALTGPAALFLCIGSGNLARDFFGNFGKVSGAWSRGGSVYVVAAT